MENPKYDVVLPPLLAKKAPSKYPALGKIAEKKPLHKRPLNEVERNPFLLSLLLSALGSPASTSFSYLTTLPVNPLIELLRDAGRQDLLNHPLYLHPSVTYIKFKTQDPFIQGFYAHTRDLEEYMGAFSTFREELEAAFALSPSSIIADFGCGCGNALEGIVERLDVHGLCITAYMPPKRREKLANSGVDVVEGILPYITLKPYYNSVALAFDVFGALYYLHHIPEMFEEALTIAFNILSPQGKLFAKLPITDPPTDWEALIEEILKGKSKAECESNTCMITKLA